MQKQRKRRRTEIGAIQLLEEAFHLLRNTPPEKFLVLYLGMVPYAAALLYFLTDVSRSASGAVNAPVTAIVMVGFYFWLRISQAHFCAGLWDLLNPGQLPKLPFRVKFAQLGALTLLQAFHLPLLIIGAFFTIPLAWVIAAFQNFTVLSLTQDYRRAPLRQLFSKGLSHSHVDWVPNHGLLIILGFASLMLWLNLIATCFALPTFAKAFFGIESAFTTNPLAALLNTSFVTGSLLLTYLLISPMLKAVYVLRCFYSESRATGADLLSRLENIRQSRQATEGVRQVKKRPSPVAPLILILWFTPSLPLAAQTPVAFTPERENAFRDSLRDTMAQKKYQWKFSRPEAEVSDSQKSWISEGLSSLAKSVRTWLKETSESFIKTIRKLLSRETPSPKRAPSDFKWGGFTEDQIRSSLTIALWFVVIGALLTLLFIVYRKGGFRRKNKPVESSISSPIDLESEDIVASQLPEDEWLKLAREQMAKGDSRLAIRAMFLATLASLGDKNLLRIARFKSNRDYFRELEIRARSEFELREAFRENTQSFEEVWYGLHQLGEDAVSHFLSNHERITQAATRNTPVSAT